jgi:hypothetical protein
LLNDKIFGIIYYVKSPFFLSILAIIDVTSTAEPPAPASTDGIDINFLLYLTNTFTALMIP